MCSMSAPESTSGKMSLPALQSEMKCDPGGYEMELVLVYNQFKSGLELFKQQADLGCNSDTRRGGSVAKDLRGSGIISGPCHAVLPDPIGPVPFTALPVSPLLRQDSPTWTQIECCSVSHSSYEHKYDGY